MEYKDKLIEEIGIIIYDVSSQGRLPEKLNLLRFREVIRSSIIKEK